MQEIHILNQMQLTKSIIQLEIMFLDRYFINNKYLYFINMFIYILFNYIVNILIVPNIATKRLKLIIRAIKDGYYGCLGKKNIHI